MGIQQPAFEALLQVDGEAHVNLKLHTIFFLPGGARGDKAPPGFNFGRMKHER